MPVLGSITAVSRAVCSSLPALRTCLFATLGLVATVCLYCCVRRCPSSLWCALSSLCTSARRQVSSQAACCVGSECCRSISCCLCSGGSACATCCTPACSCCSVSKVGSRSACASSPRRRFLLLTSCPRLYGSSSYYRDQARKLIIIIHCAPALAQAPWTLVAIILRPVAVG